MRHRRRSKKQQQFTSSVETTSLIKEQLKEPNELIDVIIAFSFPTILLSALYLWTAFASIAGGDSPELIAEACVSGVAHPVSKLNGI